MRIVAHRGESYTAPENTMPAFELAWKRNMKWLEMDIHLSKDGVIVVNHDSDTGRTGDKKFEIADSTYAELQQVDVGIKKSQRWKNTRICTLAEVLKAMPKRKGYGVLIEIKTSKTAIIESLRKVLADSGLRREQLVLMSFYGQLMRKVKNSFPDLEGRLLVGDIRDDMGRFKPSIKQIISKIHRYGLDSIGPAGSMVTQETMALFKDAGLPVHPWTIDKPSHARQLMRLGVASLTSNRAAWLESRLQIVAIFALLLVETHADCLRFLVVFVQKNKKRFCS